MAMPERLLSLSNSLQSEKGCNMIWLTVNKRNDDSIAIYKKFGMEIIRSEVTDIGNGYVMDDFVFGYKC